MCPSRFLTNGKPQKFCGCMYRFCTWFPYTERKIMSVATRKPVHRSVLNSGSLELLTSVDLAVSSALGDRNILFFVQAMWGIITKIKIMFYKKGYVRYFTYIFLNVYASSNGLRDVPFIVCQSKASVWHRKSEFAETYSESCHLQGHLKRDIIQESCGSASDLKVLRFIERHVIFTCKLKNTKKISADDSLFVIL